MQAGVPNTFDGNSIQAATTMPAAGGGEVLEQMAPGAPGVAHKPSSTCFSHTTIAGFLPTRVQRQPEHDRLEMIGFRCPA